MREVVVILATAELMIDGFELSGGLPDDLEVEPKPLVVMED